MRKPFVAVLLVWSLLVSQLAAAGPVNAATAPWGAFVAANSLLKGPSAPETSPFRVDLVTGKWTYVPSRPGAAPISMKADPLKMLRRTAMLRQRLDRVMNDKPRNAWDGNGWCYDPWGDTYEPCFMSGGAGDAMGGDPSEYAEYGGDVPWYVHLICGGTGIGAAIISTGPGLAVVGAVCGTIEIAETLATPISDALIDIVNQQNNATQLRFLFAAYLGVPPDQLPAFILSGLNCLGMMGAC
jgi:hypothetical protein